MVPITRVAADSEMMGLLVAKLHEEADELLEAATPEAREEELGDVVEVVVALFVELGLNFHFDIYKPGKKKVEELGSFRKKLVLVRVEQKSKET